MSDTEFTSPQSAHTEDSMIEDVESENEDVEESEQVEDGESVNDAETVEEEGEEAEGEVDDGVSVATQETQNEEPEEELEDEVEIEMEMEKEKVEEDQDFIQDAPAKTEEKIEDVLKLDLSLKRFMKMEICSGATPVVTFVFTPNSWIAPKNDMCQLEINELFSKKSQTLSISGKLVCDDVKNRVSNYLNTLRLKKKTSTTKMHIYESNGEEVHQLDDRSDFTIESNDQPTYIRECSKLLCSIANLYCQMPCYANSFIKKETAVEPASETVEQVQAV
jgi:hypothetical protein